MFHRVSLFWLIETKDQHGFSADKSFPRWCTGGRWYNTTICQNLHRPIFEDFFVTVRQDIYSMMCGLHIYYKLNDESTDATRFGGGRPLP